MWMKKKNKEKQIIKWFILNRRNKKKLKEIQKNGQASQYEAWIVKKKSENDDNEQSQII